MRHTDWTYRDHSAAPTRDAAAAEVRARALHNVPNATFELLNERRTATGWSFEIRRVRDEVTK